MDRPILDTSMGLRLDSRGNNGVGGRKWRLRGTSMGPRLDSRGNIVELPTGKIVHGLQWGRDLIVAETRCS